MDKSDAVNETPSPAPPVTKPPEEVPAIPEIHAPGTGVTVRGSPRGPDQS
jgi:hypothetical protein